MATRYDLNTDHWSKMRMNIIKNTINNDQRGRVVSWEKHQKRAVQRELEATIRGFRNLPNKNLGAVHNFQDILTVELDGYLPGSSYRRRHVVNRGLLPPLDKPIEKMIQYRHPLLTASQYTLMTLPTNPQSDQTRSRVPVLQCRGKI